MLATLSACLVLLLIMADKTRILQKILNLVSNACKFTHAGQVGIAVVYRTEQSIDVADWRVSHTNIGIASENMHKLFKDFSQADASTARKFGGTGLGLALSRRFARVMDGDITVTSTLGEGSVFTLTVPLIPRRAPVMAGISSHQQQQERPADALPVSG